MRLIDIDTALPPCFHALAESAFAIANGREGIDFLILIDGDDMKGYDETEREKAFNSAAEEIEKYLSETTQVIIHPDEVVRIILWSLVMASPAVDAYRARMFAYATDWGSEVSSVGEWSRHLQDVVDELVKTMSEKDRKKVYKSLSPSVRDRAIERIYWKSNDRHDSYYRSVKSILLLS